MDKPVAVPGFEATERTIKRGTWAGHPRIAGCSGETEIVLREDELWLRIHKLRCDGNIAGDQLFLYTSQQPRPVAISDLDTEGIRVPLPGTDGGGVEDNMASLIMMPLEEIRDERTGKGVHWKNMGSLFICRPGLQLVLDGSDIPTTVFGFCTLHEVSAAEAGLVERAKAAEVLGTALGKFASSDRAEVPPAAGSQIVGKSWVELAEVSASAFAQLGKDIKTSSISFSEFKLLLGFLGITFPEARAWLWFQSADVSANGALEHEELQFALRMVQELKLPSRLLPRDAYFMFDTHKRTPKTRFRLGTIDIIAFVEILAAYGVRVAPARAEALFGQLDARGTLRIGYQQFMAGFCQLLDPRVELTKRGINPMRLPPHLPRSQRDAAAMLVQEDERAMLSDIKAAVQTAAEARKQARLARDKVRKGDWVRRQIETRRAKRELALQARERQRETATAAKAKAERGEEEARLRSGMERKAMRETHSARKRSNRDATAAEAEARTRLAERGFDRITLARRGLTHLPAALWKNLSAAELLSRVLLFDASHNVIERLPGDALLGRLGLLRKLDLSHNRLVELPLSLPQSLPRLQILDVSANSLQRLPPALDRLGALQLLDASHNALVELPSSLSRLSALKALRLHNNCLPALPDGIGGACGAGLTQLTLHSNCLEALPDSVTACAKLAKLDLSWNRFRRLPDSLGRMCNLQLLDVSHCQLVELPESLGECSRLQRMVLHDNSLSRLPESLCRLSALVALDASRNRVAHLPAEIGDCEALMDLRAPHNRLQAVPTSLGRLAELQLLDLSHNRLLVLPPDVAGCRSLRHVTLAHNLLGTDGVDPIPSSFAALKELVFLDLSFNHISFIGAALGRHCKIAHLNLANNALASLPAGVYALPALVELHAGSNRITELDDAICTALPRLRTLDLSQNILERIPQRLYLLTGLRHLNLFNNRLDTLPLTLGGMVGQLDTLDVARNPLRELPRKLPGTRVPGAEALSVQLGSGNAASDEGFLLQLHRQIKANRRREAVAEADWARDLLDGERQGLAAEDTRAQRWHRHRQHIQLLCWHPASGRRLHTPIGDAVRALQDPFDRTRHSLATWFQGAASPDKRVAALPGPTARPAATAARNARSSCGDDAGDVRTGRSRGTGSAETDSGTGTGLARLPSPTRACGGPAISPALPARPATTVPRDRDARTCAPLSLPARPQDELDAAIAAFAGRGEPPPVPHDGSASAAEARRPHTALGKLRSAPAPAAQTIALLRRGAERQPLRPPGAPRWFGRIPAPGDLELADDALRIAGGRGGGTGGGADSAAMQHKVLPAPPGGPPFFRFGTGIASKVHLGAPDRPIDVHEEGVRRGGSLEEGVRRGGSLEQPAPAGSQAASQAARPLAGECPDGTTTAPRSPSRRGYGSLSPAAFASLRRLRKGRFQAERASDASWLRASEGPVPSSRSTAQREIRLADARMADHSRAPDWARNFQRASLFSRGYTTLDVGEALMLQARFHARALDEWELNAAQYMLRERSLDDFRAAVRRRCGDDYDAQLQLLVDQFFVLATDTGVPPTFGSFSRAEMRGIRALREAGRRAVDASKREVAASVRQRRAQLAAKYAVSSAELGHRVLRREAESEARGRQREAEEAARLRRKALRAQARIEANAAALDRMKCADAVSTVRGLQRDVAGRVRRWEQQAALRRMVAGAAEADAVSGTCV